MAKLYAIPSAPILTREAEDKDSTYPPSGDNGVMESYAKDYVDQKFETERVKTDSRFIEVLSEIRVLREETKSLREASLTRTQLWGAVATILGVLLAVLAFAGDRFDAGINVSDDLRRIQTEQAERDASQDARLGQILSAIEGLRADQP